MFGIDPKASEVKAAHAGSYGQPPAAAGITFDRFVRACVVVKTLSESFQKVRFLTAMS